MCTSHKYRSRATRAGDRPGDAHWGYRSRGARPNAHSQLTGLRSPQNLLVACEHGTRDHEELTVVREAHVRANHE